MTIEREFTNGPFIARCDGKKCHEYLETGETNFGSAVGEIKVNRWEVRKIDGEWQHFCPDCR